MASLIPGCEKVLEFTAINRLGNPDTVDTMLVTVRVGVTTTTYTYGVDPEIILGDTPGKYIAMLPLPVAGTYYWRCETTGVNAALEGQFNVKDSLF